MTGSLLKPKIARFLYGQLVLTDEELVLLTERGKLNTADLEVLQGAMDAIGDHRATMRPEYQIEPFDSQFTVINLGVHGWASIPPKKPLGLEACKRQDAMRRTAKLIIDVALRSHLQLHEVDRQATRDWISSATELV